MNLPENPGLPNPEGDEDLFDSIRQFLSEQSGEDIYEALARAYRMASTFAENELKGRIEYARMLRGIERLIDDVIEVDFDAESRVKLAEVLYIYGLAHYSILQQMTDDDGSETEGLVERASRPLLVHDVWFPTNIGVEAGDEGYFLHVGDGRIDISIYMGEEPNQRGLLVDFVDHWEFAASQTKPNPTYPEYTQSAPLLAVEMDYAGSELVDAGDHVDVLLLDHRAEPFIRLHARDSDLRAIVDAIQEMDREDEF